MNEFVSHDGKIPMLRGQQMNDPKKAASMLLNRYGIPGLRYFDQGSRDGKNSTHNFVIWNTKTLKAFGISEDSENDARRYFQNGGSWQNRLFDDNGEPQTYYQILGEKGARELDKQEGNTYRMDNLAVAKEMTAAGKDAKTIRLATGWELAQDGKWRWEIMDGDFDWRKLYKKIHQDENNIPSSVEFPLNEIFSNDELYKAYPSLNESSVMFLDLGERENGNYDHDTKNIMINMMRRPHAIQSTLIHEIQHAIQDIEGFARGGDEEMFEDNEVSLERLEHNLRWLKDRYKHESSSAERETLSRQIKELEDRISEVEENALDGMVEVDGELYDDRYDAYRHLHGEAYARVAQAREDFTEEQRRKTTLAETLDTDKPLIERYNQAIAANDKRIDSQEQIDAVRQQYEGTDKWHKAPNGKESKLNEKQWLQVRTPNFKKWFGDWEMIANARPDVIANTREEATEVLNNLRGKELKSEVENITATISKDGREKMVSGAAMNKSLKNGFSRADHFTAVANIEKLFKNSIKSNERADDNEQLKAIEHFSAPIMLEGIEGEDDPALATFTVKVTENAGRKIYSIEVMNLSRVEGMLPGNVIKTHRASSTPDVLNISRIADAFNNTSKVVDENGEPLVVWHGTDEENNFSVFDINAQGAHFGTREQAENRNNGNLYPVFLKIRNPKRMYDQGNDWYRAVKSVKESGTYDGIVYENQIEGKGDSWVVINPEQIKSATDNRGTFDGNNPDIYYQAFRPHQAINEWFKKGIDWLHGKDIEERSLVSSAG